MVATGEALHMTMRDGTPGARSHAKSLVECHLPECERLLRVLAFCDKEHLDKRDEVEVHEAWADGLCAALGYEAGDMPSASEVAVRTLLAEALARMRLERSADLEAEVVGLRMEAERLKAALSVAKGALATAGHVGTVELVEGIEDGRGQRRERGPV